MKNNNPNVIRAVIITAIIEAIGNEMEDEEFTFAQALTIAQGASGVLLTNLGFLDPAPEVKTPIEVEVP